MCKDKNDSHCENASHKNFAVINMLCDLQSDWSRIITVNTGV